MLLTWYKLKNCTVTQINKLEWLTNAENVTTVEIKLTHTNVWLSTVIWTVTGLTNCNIVTRQG